ncbi:hypothetical protein DFH11DRAFT_54684 [Phellopilus nigrolimitatus]|nr:hypothetical protein DFH11DRAFT_54684 [Phellopilus nigrolimitatus]
MPPDSWKTSFPLAQFLLDNTVSRQFRDLQNDHPLRIAARTYALSLSLSLGPALIPILAEGRLSRKRLMRLISASRKELSVTGFAFAMTVAVGGGAALEHYWRRLDHRETRPSLPGTAEKIALRVESLLQKINFTASRRAFLCNAISSLLAIILMQARRRSSQTRKANIPLTIPISPPEKLLDKKTSATLDLTLLLLVRALDAAFQGLFLREAEVRVEDRRSNNEGPEKTSESVRELRKKAAVMTDKLDALVFWAASARIMWCFFYLPRRLPRSYVKWIRTMANVDDRLLEALRRIRAGTWSYGAPASHTLLAPMAEGLGYASAWADPLQLPPIGGRQADKTWELLGVKGRAGVGGLPCEIVHGNVGSWLVPGGVGGNCFANVLARGAMGFFEALAIYAPVHFLPIVLTGPRKLLSFSLLMKTTLALLRSSLFLSCFYIIHMVGNMLHSHSSYCSTLSSHIS